MSLQEDYLNAFKVAEELYGLSPTSKQKMDAHAIGIAQKIISEGISPSDVDESTLAFAKKIESNLISKGIKGADFDVVYAAAKEFLIRVPYFVEAPPALQLKPKPAVAGTSELVAVPEAPADAPYSIYENNFRSPEELLHYHEVFPSVPIRNLCFVRPERQVLHEMVVNLVLNVSFSDERALKVYSQELAEEFLQGHQGFEDQMLIFRTQKEEEVMLALEGKGVLSQEARVLVTQFVDQIEGKLPVEELDEEAKKTIAKRVADHLCSKKIESEVKSFISKSEYFEELPKIPSQGKEKRRLLMINGGIASGKGSSEATIEKKMKEEGISWGDVAKINTDMYKQILLDPKDLPDEMSHFYSGLVHDEASLIRNRIYDEYMKKVEEDTAPHVCFDQVWTQQEIVEFGGKTKQGIDVYLVQTPVESSVRMAFSRGASTGRFETTKGILSTHKNVPNQLEKTISFAMQRGAKNIRLHFMANVGKGVPAMEVGLLDFQSKIIAMPAEEEPEREYLEGFYKKTKINVDATEESKIYASADLPNVRELTREKLQLLFDAMAS